MKSDNPNNKEADISRIEKESGISRIEKEAGIDRIVSKACVAPGQDDWVYDYFNQQLNERGEQAFEQHLFECDRCKQILQMLDWAYAGLRRINAQKETG